jgi:hypothetical protein
MTIMVKGKKNKVARASTKKTAIKKKTVATASRKSGRGGSVGGEPRKCGICRKLGHNRRSHGPGGLLSR